MLSHQIDNKGNHLLVSEEASINVPAIAAAHVTKRYTAQATDELTFEVTRVWEPSRLLPDSFGVDPVSLSAGSRWGISCQS